MKRIEDSLRDFWDNIKHTNIWVIEIPQEEEKKNSTEEMFDEIIVENFHSMEKEIVNQFQEEQRVPYRINPKRNILRHILIDYTLVFHHWLLYYSEDILLKLLKLCLYISYFIYEFNFKIVKGQQRICAL